jgi:hypothetical protein
MSNFISKTLGNPFDPPFVDPVSLEVCKFKYDPIAMSWRSYRSGTRWNPIDNMVPDDDDYRTAVATRKYYRNRFTLQVLRGVGMNDFQTNLYKFIEGGELIKKNVGMLYKLPYFYTADVAFDDIVENCQSVSEENTPYGRPDGLSRRFGSATAGWYDRTDTLSPLKTIFIAAKSGEAVQYWWKNLSGHAVCLRVPTNNIFHSMINDIFCNEPAWKISANWIIRTSPASNFSYWSISDIKPHRD